MSECGVLYLNTLILDPDIMRMKLNLIIGRTDEAGLRNIFELKLSEVQEPLLIKDILAEPNA